MSKFLFCMIARAIECILGNICLKSTSNKVRNILCLVEILMICFQNICALNRLLGDTYDSIGERSHLFANHVNRILNAAVGNNRNDRSICYSKVLNSVYTKLRINHALVDTFGESRGATRVWLISANCHSSFNGELTKSSLTSVQDCPIHLIVGLEGHFPRIL